MTPPTAESSEHYHQAWLVKLFRQAYPDQTIFAIPNGGKRGKAQAASLKAEGVMPGVWDLFWLESGCWIEMKKPKGRLSPDQIRFGKAAEAAGYRLIVGYGWEDAWKQIQPGKERYWQLKLQSATGRG